MVKISQAKTKGRNYQKDIVMQLRRSFNLDMGSDDCYNGDIQCRQMGGNGVDIMLSSAAQKIIPLSIECKRTERLNIWLAIEQMNKNKTSETIPVLVFRRNKSKSYACLPFADLIDLVKNQKIA